MLQQMNNFVCLAKLTMTDKAPTIFSQTGQWSLTHRSLFLPIESYLGKRDNSFNFLCTEIVIPWSSYPLF